MDIAVFRRKSNHYVAYFNDKEIARFDYAVPIVIVEVSETGGCLFENGKAACWSPDWETPGLALLDEPKSDTCVIMDQHRKPILDAGLIQSKCPERKGKCMPTLTIVFAVFDEEFNRKAGGLKLYSYTFVGDEVGGRADHEQMLFSPRSYNSILKMRKGNDCAKFKVYLNWSDKNKRSYIHIPDDTSIGPNPAAEQANYDALVKMWSKHEINGTNAILLSVDPRTWSKDFKVKAKEKDHKSKDAKRVRAINLQLSRTNLKPETRERLSAERSAILGE